MTAITPAPGDGLEIEGARHIQIDTGDVKLHAVEAGKGPLVVLLHGFPEFWWTWVHQIPALAAAGFHVVAPDLRGYNLSDRPRRVRDYAFERLTDDVAAIIRAMGETKAHVVGHDWGGGIAYSFAMVHPEMMRRLAILNAPHPEAFRIAVLSTWRQFKKSWYVLFFQIPWLPEKLLRRDDYKELRAALRMGRPGVVPDSEVEPYVDAARRSEGLFGGIHYYRAMARSALFLDLPKPRVIECPVLVVWGRNDDSLGEELAEPPKRWVTNARVEKLPNASHWVQLDEPEKVNRLLVEFLST